MTECITALQLHRTNIKEPLSTRSPELSTAFRNAVKYTASITLPVALCLIALSEADTKEEALKEIREAIELHLESKGEGIPVSEGVEPAEGVV